MQNLTRKRMSDMKFTFQFDWGQVLKKAIACSENSDSSNFN